MVERRCQIGKIAISLPDEVLDAVEKEHIECGTSRTEYFRQPVEEQLPREKEKEDVARYIQGYLDHLETPEEMAWVGVTIQYAFDDDSWEDDYNK